MKTHHQFSSGLVLVLEGFGLEGSLKLDYEIIMLSLTEMGTVSLEKQNNNKKTKNQIKQKAIPLIAGITKECVGFYS